MNNNICKGCGVNRVVNDTEYCSLDCKINHYTNKSLNPIHMINPLEIMNGSNTSECDIWEGPMYNGSTPTVIDHITNKTLRVRKYLYEKFKKPVPHNKYIGTICNNPRCVRVEHLILKSKTSTRKCIHCDKEFITGSNAEYCSPMCKLEHHTDKTSNPNGCWLWTGSVASTNTNKVYGIMHIDGKQVHTHRYAYTQKYGEIPKNGIILHTCNNRLCVNPEHIQLGDMTDKIYTRSCLYCGKEFTSASTSSKCCSTECYIEYNTDRSEYPQGCHIWTGYMNKDGHAIVSEGKKHIYVRRHIYQQLHGDIPNGMYVYTTCGDKLCINPDHMYLLSYKTYDATCKHCGKVFTGSTNSKYCSIRCYFEHYVDKTSDPDGCWLWTGNTHIFGYGHVMFRGEQITAHRYSYELYKGPIPEGMLILHSCDNPRCVNSDHLRVGTYKDNSQDMVDRDRHVRGERNHAAKLTDDEVREIRKSQLTTRELSEEYGVHESTIISIKKGKSWKHLLEED